MGDRWHPPDKPGDNVDRALPSLAGNLAGAMVVARSPEQLAGPHPETPDYEKPFWRQHPRKDTNDVGVITARTPYRRV